MSYQPPGTLRVLRLLAWTSLLRWLRSARIASSKRQRQPGARTATARKRRDPLLILMVAMLPIFALQSLVVTSMAVQRLADAVQARATTAPKLEVRGGVFWLLQSRPEIEPAELAQQLSQWGVDENSTPSLQQIVDRFRHHGVGGFAEKEYRNPFLIDAIPWHDPTARDAFVGGGTLLALAMLALLLVIGIGGANATLAGGDWTFAWLMTFPVATRSLMLARAVEYSLVQFFPWATLFPLLLQLLRALDQPAAVLLAAVATLTTTFLTGSIRLWLETSLRLRLSLHALRSIQGACSLLALLLMGAVFGVCLGQHIPDWFVDLAIHTPAWLAALPGAWPLALCRDGLIAALPGLAATLLLVAVACVASARLLAHGTMRTAGVDPGSRGRANAWSKSMRRLDVVGKDLALLLRDRNFLVQTLLVPMFVVVLQLVINPDLGSSHGHGPALVAYGVGLYSVIGGCFQVLSAEGRALWMLYALPVGLADVLRRKTRLWATTAVGLGLAALVVLTWRSPGEVHLEALLVDALFVGVGIWCSAHIAASISILGTDTTMDYVARQPKLRHIYLYFFLASTYFAPLQSQELAVRIAGVPIFATLAFSIWQRACDRVPWLLDPVAERRDRIGVYDGGGALIVFSTLQSVALTIAMRAQRDGGTLGWLPQFIAFASAGGITVLLYLILLAVRDVDVAIGLGLRIRSLAAAAGSVLAGTVAGLAIGLLGLGYVHLMRHTGWVELPPAPAGDRTALFLLAVCVAPVVEEILFRGLLLQGMGRSVSRVPAILWSAALFAAVHPVGSWPPVFVLGVIAAFVFQRTGFLPAAIATHATYNVVVVAMQ